MRTFVVTPPSPIVTFEDADDHLKLSGDATQTAEVEAMIAAATGHLDGPTGWLGRALGQQTLEARFDSWECGSLVLPYPEIQSITSVKYVDANGVEQTVAAEDYELLGRSVQPAYGIAWPSLRYQREAVRIRYVAGYAVGHPGLKIARAAILLMVGDLYRFRETAAPGSASAIPMSTTVENLLAPLRVYG